jgi:DNA anti-recombination protein RmuC
MEELRRGWVKMRTKLSMIAVIALGINLIVFPGFSWAQTNASSDNPGGEEVKREAQLREKANTGYRGFTKEDLLRLKKENPEKFQETVRQIRKRIVERLERLKQTDPQRYNRIMQGIRQRQVQNLARLKKENPEKFQEIIKKRQEAIRQRLEKMKTENPKEYQRSVQRIKQIQGVRRFRRENPAAFNRFLKNHPVIRRRLNRYRNAF